MAKQTVPPLPLPEGWPRRVRPEVENQRGREFCRAQRRPVSPVTALAREIWRARSHRPLRHNLRTRRGLAALALSTDQLIDRDVFRVSSEAGSPEGTVAKTLGRRENP